MHVRHVASKRPALLPYLLLKKGLTCSKDIWVAAEDLLYKRAPRAGHTNHKNRCVIFEADGIVQELCNIVAWDVQLLVAKDIHDQLQEEGRKGPQRQSFAGKSNSRLADGWLRHSVLVLSRGQLLKSTSSHQRAACP